jgi:hypothetical protein
MKSLPVISESVDKLIKAYFYLNPKNSLFQNILTKKSKSSRSRIRSKRISTQRIFVSKPEMKHTNDKAIITIFTHNRPKRIFMQKLKKINTKDIFYRKEISTILLKR